MKNFEFSTIRRKLTFWFLFLTLVPLLISGIVAYMVSSNEFAEKTFNKLTAIRDLKVGQLQMWIAERRSDIDALARNELLANLDNLSVESDFQLPGNTTKSRIRELMRHFQYSHDVYKEIFIVDAMTKKVLVSTSPPFEGADKSTDEYFLGPLKTGRTYVKDIYYSNQLGEITMSFSKPLRKTTHPESEIIGVLVAYVNLKNSLYPVLANRTGLGHTGETLIVNRDFIAISELRHYPNAPLNFKMNALPALNAARGETGLVVSEDYAGNQVLAAYTFVPETGWGFVCKQDWAELNQPMQHLETGLLILFIISIVIISGVVYLLSKSISSPIVALASMTQKVTNGDYTVRTRIHSKDEIGFLGDAVNQMVSGIETKNIVQAGITTISEAVIGHQSRQNYSLTVLQRLLHLTGAELAVFYSLNDTGSVYEPLNAIGANPELLEPFSAVNPEGELGYAAVEKKIRYLQNLPEDTRYRYKTSAGDMIAKELITIPLLKNNGEVSGVISLASVHEFAPEVMEMMNLAVTLITASYANLLSAEQTRELADNLVITNQQLEVQTEELQEQSEELQEQAIELQRSADELLLQNQELELQRIRVEETTRLKSEFLSNMSHELRTPLNSINALSRVLMMTAREKLTEEENTYLEVVERNGKRLLSLINDILDLSKVEAGKIELEPRPFSLSTLLNQVKENLLPLADQKKIELRMIKPDREIEIATDENRLHQILTNVIGNAVKFTDRGNVKVTAIQGKETVTIKVQDTGIGISEEMLPFIFEEFRQADGSTSRTYEGTGLGLAIAQKLARALRGNITVESTVGVGSTFTLVLPLKWDGFINKSASFSWMQDQNSDEERKTILVVDDNPEIVEYISESLKTGGYQTIGASTGKEALRLAETVQPYAITLDIIMPEMDGWEVLQRLKMNPHTAAIPVIVISMANDRQTGLALGAVGYLSKPVDRQLLIREIKRVNPHQATVMIVDDNAVDRKMIHDILLQENLHGLQAESGSQCLDLLRTHYPDVIILDLMMPGMDGFHVLDEIRKNNATRDLPVIVVTAKNLTVADKRKLSGRVATVLTKSKVTPEQIFQEIKRILSKMEPDKGTPLQTPSGGAAPKKILIVEDNAVAVLQVRQVLELEGFIVDVVDNGLAAIDYVKHTIPDGIVLDLMMPGVDGFEVLEKIRSTPATRKLPVLILTAKNLTHDDLTRLSVNNIQQLIQKGDVDVHGLLGKIKTMLGLDTDSGSGSNQPVVSNPSKKSSLPSTTPEPARVQRLGVSKILIVEDNADNRLTVRAILEEEFLLVEAVDGEEGLAMAISERPDLVLLDISLPKMNGYEVVKHIKGNDLTKHIPVIALTAKAMKNDREEIMAAGCDEYVAKPIDHNDLLRKIEMFLHR